MTGGVIWWLFKVVSDTRLLLFLCTWTLTLTVPGKLHAIKAARYKKTSVRWRVLYHGYHGPNIIDVRMVDFCTVLFHGRLFNPNILHQYRGKRISDTRRTSLHEAVMIPLHGPHPLRITSRNGKDVESMILGRTASRE